MSRLIDADELRSGLFHLEGETGITDRQLGYQAGWNDALMYGVLDAPTVDAVPLEDYKSMESTVNKLTQALANSEKHGHWTDNGHIGKRRWCSVCGGIAFEEYDDYGLAEATETDYCPHCGAKMDEVEDE